MAFFGFAAWTLRGDDLGEKEDRRPAAARRSAIVATGSAFFLAELGDKTMLATITLATSTSRCGCGSARRSGMVAADALAIGVGKLLGSRLPERVIKIFAAGAFIVFGSILVLQGLGIL